MKLNDISYDSIDNLIRKIMRSHNITAKQLHNAFKNKYKKTPDDWIKEKMKKIHEDHKEIASGKKADDEGYMARNELDSIERAIKNLRKSIKSGNQQLPAWVQSKITKAADYIDTAAEYLQSDEKIEEGTNLHSLDIDPQQIKKSLRDKKIRTLAQQGSTSGERNAAQNKRTGPSIPYVKPGDKDIRNINAEYEPSLVEKILGEERCGKGMYWCNTDKKCKPMSEGMNVPGQKIKPTEVGIGKSVAESCNHSEKGKSCPVHGQDACPISEEKDPKGPVKSYKSPEEISKKHGVSLDHIKKQLEIGTKVEFEHTTSKSAARITALQHLDERPDYYTKLKKMETQKESSIIRDANGNVYAEFIDIIKSGSIEEENPGLWANIRKRREKGLPKKKPGQKGYPETLDIEEGIEQARKNVGASKCWKNKKLGNPPTKIKDGEEVPNCVEEAARMPAQTGNNIFVTLSWRGKYYTVQIFFPQAKIPSRLEISDEIQKIYPGSRVVTYRISQFKDGEPLIYAYKGESGGKLGPNKNYVKPMGEEVEISEAKKSEMPCNKPKAEAHGSGETGKSHVVKACSGGEEKLIRFGQKGVKGSPKKEGESKEYASRRHEFKLRHAKNIAKGPMSAAYWANKVKW